MKKIESQCGWQILDDDGGFVCNVQCRGFDNEKKNPKPPGFCLFEFGGQPVSMDALAWLNREFGKK